MIAALVATGVVLAGFPLCRVACAVRSVPSHRSTTTGADVGSSHGRAAHPARRRIVRWALVVATIAIALDPMVAMIVGAGLLSWPRLDALVSSRRARAHVERAIPDAIELLVLLIHAGLTPHQAVATMTSRGPAATRVGFSEVTRRIDRGQGLADALAALPDVLGPNIGPVADTLAIAERHGTPIAGALEQLSVEVRHRRRRDAEAAARRLPIRLSFPLVVCTLPSFVLVAIAPAVLAALSSLGDTSW